MLLFGLEEGYDVILWVICGVMCYYFGYRWVKMLLLGLEVGWNVTIWAIGGLGVILCVIGG